MSLLLKQNNYQTEHKHVLMRQKIYFILFLSSISFVASAQMFQGTLIKSPGSSNKVQIIIKPDANFVGHHLTAVVFNLQVLNTVSPQPSISVVSLTPTFGNNFTLNSVFNDGTFLNYYLSNTSSGVPDTSNLLANHEQPIVEVTFSGGPVEANNEVRLANLPAGGATGVNQFYVEGNVGAGDLTNYNNMFYGVGAVQGSISDGYNSYNFVPVLNVSLPVNWLGFNVVRANNDASIDWRVTNEYRNREYELERSTDGKSFTGIGNVSAKNNQSAINDYSFIDKNITSLGTSIVYYRLKQTDVDNKFTYSEVRILKLDKLGGGISIFPNPVRDGFYVRISTPLASNTKVGLKLMNQLGQVLDAREISSGVASNYYFDIKKSANIIAGQYNLQVITDGNILESKKIIVADR
jgi:hypothetical protein